jgi:ribosomal protein S12 methylthiotransferase
LIDQIRAAAPEAGIRSNVIVGFPGETQDDLAELEAFLIDARMDAVGVFGYSDEDGTAAADLAGKLHDDLIAERVERVSALVEELTAQRAEDRVGTEVIVLVDEPEPDSSADGDSVVGRAEHQAPEVDGSTTVQATDLLGVDGMCPGDLVRCRVVDTDGIDLYARAVEVIGSAPGPTTHTRPCVAVPS